MEVISIGDIFVAPSTSEIDTDNLSENELIQSLVARHGAPLLILNCDAVRRQYEFLSHALQYGCTRFVVDSINELEKFIPYRDEADVLVRLSFRNASAYADLSKKFGCSPAKAIEIIQRAFELGIRVKGLSFHVGSQTAEPEKYVQAINSSLEVINDVAALGLPALSMLDIGGGFPVEYTEDVMPIDEFCAPIREALGQLPDSVSVIAEPGRFLVASAITSVALVMGQAMREGRTWYYLDDGVYGSFSGIIYDHGHYPVDALNWEGERFPSVLAGPTCDSIDVIDEDIMLPKMANGDLIIGRMMGAYTSASATEFNFFRKAEIVVINDCVQKPEAVKLKSHSHR